MTPDRCEKVKPAGDFKSNFGVAQRAKPSSMSAVTMTAVVVVKSDYLREHLVNLRLLTRLIRAVVTKHAVQAIRRKDFYWKTKTINMKYDWLKSIPPRVGWYLAGFADGEGSFNVSMRKRDSGIGWQLDPSFNVSQKDETILILFKRYLGCGTLRQRRDGVIYFEVRNIAALHDKVIPFFERFALLSASKKKNFAIFKRIDEAMWNKEREFQEGFKKILELREKLNEGRGRKRKYTIQDLNINQ